MAVDLELAPKQKRPVGEPCCEPVVYPEIEREHAERMAAVATFGLIWSAGSDPAERTWTRPSA